MTIEDTSNIIQRKIWTVDEILSQLDEITEKIETLSPEERKGIPVFPNDWSETGVKKYVKEVEKAVNDPIKYKNKKRLDEIGVKTEAISDDILGDTRGISDIFKLFDEIRSTDHSISEKLIGEAILTKWLKEDITTAKEKLQGIVDARPAFRRIAESEVGANLKSDILTRAILDISLLAKGEDVISKSTYLRDYEVVLEYEGDLEKYSVNLDETWDEMQQIQDEYGISRERIRELINNRNLLEASALLKEAHVQYATEKRKLLEERQLYSGALGSLGEEVLEPPQYLHELVKDIENLRSRCMEHLGESGLKLLKFLKEEGEFPEEVGMEEIKRALEALRPFFLRTLTGAS